MRPAKSPSALRADPPAVGSRSPAVLGPSDRARMRPAPTLGDRFADEKENLTRNVPACWAQSAKFCDVGGHGCECGANGGCRGGPPALLRSALHTWQRGRHQGRKVTTPLPSVCTPLPSVCTPLPSVCTLSPSVCTPSLSVCTPLPSRICTRTSRTHRSRLPPTRHTSNNNE
eukprot:8730905-Pyramimonas_sp.AAC.1